jgi:hypothetical protein
MSHSCAREDSLLAQRAGLQAAAGAFGGETRFTPRM